jgi:hypothetical protein
MATIMIRGRVANPLCPSAKTEGVLEFCIQIHPSAEAERMNATSPYIKRNKKAKPEYAMQIPHQ